MEGNPYPKFISKPTLIIDNINVEVKLETSVSHFISSNNSNSNFFSYFFQNIAIRSKDMKRDEKAFGWFITKIEILHNLYSNSTKQYVKVLYPFLSPSNSNKLITRQETYTSNSQINVFESTGYPEVISFGISYEHTWQKSTTQYFTGKDWSYRVNLPCDKDGSDFVFFQEYPWSITKGNNALNFNSYLNNTYLQNKNYIPSLSTESFSPKMTIPFISKLPVTDYTFSTKVIVTIAKIINKEVIYFRSGEVIYSDNGVLLNDINELP